MFLESRINTELEQVYLTNNKEIQKSINFMGKTLKPQLQLLKESQKEIQNIESTALESNQSYHLRAYQKSIRGQVENIEQFDSNF